MAKKTSWMRLGSVHRMNCPRCKVEIDIQKNTYKKCTCGVTLMCIKINNKLIVEDVTKNKEEK